jgi:hypothetical protein
VPSWHGSLRRACFISATATITYGLIRGATVIGIIGVGSRGDWGRGHYSRKWCSFGVGGILLVHLLFFLIRVAEDDDLAIAGWPKELAVEVAKEPFGELRIP